MIISSTRISIIQIVSLFWQTILALKIVLSLFARGMIDLMQDRLFVFINWATSKVEVDYTR